MPIYEFRCAQCGHVQEIIVSSASTETEMQCKECRGEEMVRIMSCTNFAMGSSKSSGPAVSAPSCTNRSCGPGSNCSTLTLPGHTRD